MLTLVGLIYRTPEDGIERRTPSKIEYQSRYFDTYMTEVLLIQRMTRRPSPVNQFREKNYHFFRTYKSCKQLYLKLI